MRYREEGMGEDRCDGREKWSWVELFHPHLHLVMGMG